VTSSWRRRSLAEGLVLRKVAVRYGDALAVAEVTLELGPGARIGIVGRNGAGKSSLLNAIAGIVRISDGELLWDGVSIARRSAHVRVRRGISLVPEGRRVFPGLSVEDNLRVGGFSSPRGFAERRDEVLELFPELADRRTQAAAQLSGGEAQMLAIGQALMARPRLVLLDEPSLGLAPIVVSNLLGTMQRLSEQGIAVLLVEQSVRLAQRFADELYVIDGGRMQLLRGAGQELDEEALQAAYLGERKH
jgi:branched-chain amino acid transport system ATP-binding protein